MARYSGYSTVLKMDVASVYTLIAQVIDINGPAIKGSLIDVTDRDTSGKKTYLGGLVDNGQVKLKLNFDPDNAQHSLSGASGLGTLAQSGAAKSFRLEYGDTTPTTVTFSAIVLEFNPDAPLNGPLTADCTLQISGALTVA